MENTSIDDGTGTGSTSASLSDDWLFDGLDTKRPPSWARIGLFGSHRSGKELFVASVAGMSSSSPKPADLNAEAHNAGTFLAAAEPPLCQPLQASPAAAVQPTCDREDAALMSFMCDAAMTLMECGAHCVGGTYPQPTRAQLRIAMPKAEERSGSPLGRGKSHVGQGPEQHPHHVDIEVVNYWSFLADEEVGHAASGPQRDPEESVVVVLPDIALTTCDAFLVVLDLSRYDTYTYCSRVLSKLHNVYHPASPKVEDGDDGGAHGRPLVPNSSKLVAAVLASTHRLAGQDNSSGDDVAIRSVSSDECRALGTRWGVPVFEVSLSPADALRHRKVLEKIISRVMHLRGAI